MLPANAELRQGLISLWAGTFGPRCRGSWVSSVAGMTSKPSAGWSADHTAPVPTGPSVELYWLPLGAGAGNGIVRLSGRMYEARAARRAARPRMALFHSALRVVVDGELFVIEMTPVWGNSDPDRGVVAEGAVGLPGLRSFSLFRYEVRRWLDGNIPDIAYAVDSPRLLSADHDQARRLLGAVPMFPTATWGLDELGTGEMWNSNSLIAWLLAVSGHDMAGTAPPAGGRAPGWDAGLAIAADPAGHRRGSGWSASRPRGDRP